MIGVVVWITGLPSCGKSTLAARLAASLRAEGIACAVLDGDAVREALVPRPGYDPAARDAFYATLARLAALLARQGLVAVVAATAPRRAHRSEARRLTPSFVEVSVEVAATECAARDPKGLWARAARGELPDFPGVATPYEPPEAPDVVARGGEDAAALDGILDRVRFAMVAARRS